MEIPHDTDDEVFENVKSSVKISVFEKRFVARVHNRLRGKLILTLNNINCSTLRSKTAPPSHFVFTASGGEIYFILSIEFVLIFSGVYPRVGGYSGGHSVKRIVEAGKTIYRKSLLRSPEKLHRNRVLPEELLILLTFEP